MHTGFGLNQTWQMGSAGPTRRRGAASATTTIRRRGSRSSMTPDSAATLPARPRRNRIDTARTRTVNGYCGVTVQRARRQEQRPDHHPPPLLRRHASLQSGYNCTEATGHRQPALMPGRPLPHRGKGEQMPRSKDLSAPFPDGRRSAPCNAAFAEFKTRQAHRLGGQLFHDRPVRRRQIDNCAPPVMGQWSASDGRHSHQS